MHQTIVRLLVLRRIEAAQIDVGVEDAAISVPHRVGGSALDALARLDDAEEIEQRARHIGRNRAFRSTRIGCDRAIVLL